MTEILIQSALAVRNGEQLADEVARIRQRCAADHDDDGSHKPIVECPDCFEKLLEAVRSRYLNSAPASSGDQQEWFSSRRAFLQELDTMFADAKEYQLDPRAIDDRIQEERSRWYAENVRASLLRLMVEDPAGREVVFEKLEDPPIDLAGLAKEISEILTKGLASQGGESGEADIPARLLAATDPSRRIEILRSAFFRNGGDGEHADEVPEDHQKYFDMLRDHSSMEQVVERVLEERQVAAGARERTGDLNRRLDELRRARAAHELEKSRKLKNRESYAEQRIPNELYDLPPCAVCGEEPSTKDFYCCPICAIFVWREIQHQPTVFCSRECEEEGHSSHSETHTCASGDECVQLQPQDEDERMQEDIEQNSNPNPSKPNNEIQFCRECTSPLKIPTMWCSVRCADANFQRHRETVHMPARKRLGYVVTDRDRLDYSSSGGPDSETRYHAKNISDHLASYSTLVGEWEETNIVRLRT
ncbi:hypothetical protein B0H63DRAFT_11044 [Podospora didyma]|uniref:Suppressor of anucleate metulae protein B n=1 Tax=Podospora didyma TaxID=330526 RepID=A0AAE0U6X7_9PEZI|nr:hypothetical protein B0H63DRAFT_11044 [Podospora didyma]